MSHDTHDQTGILIKMVNQIAANLSAYPHDEAASRIAQHLTKFWAPKMRQDLFAAANNGASLSPVVYDAIAQMQNQTAHSA
ncbi:NADH-dependent formate dehydrogenase delta subunit FdsD [Methylophaga frappieri]|jgi:formate dehydrogenase subunit delta|uniref:NADH-dependent formate dehydrogenase delta subunit FdsD n=1 Tax=Methylophaga frappieri (strain ATCC BAA-2434 / DSM 25690 / JAM7) TaxID=754477 RepID=I1YI74_METFJ|nr:formate dehydrogenase subunit delta [Methylophaga frappieri]AFJ02617.1 NADH-dependent formate dehydrogenase delta subunit FdsD [Methylophaga frappieri]